MKTSIKVLYAEDDPDIQMIATIALEDVSGFNLYLCNNGREALNMLENFKPDLILLDVMMPTMDGPTALSELQKHHGENLPPVVFITAKASPQEISRLMAMGAIDVISKPFDPNTLADDILAILEKRST